MLTKEKIIEFMERAAYKPLTTEELMNELAAEPTSISQILRELETEGKIYFTKSGRYGLPEKMDLVVGTLQGHPKGFGFLIPDKPGIADIYIGSGNLKGAMNNDKIVVKVITKPGQGEKLEGETVKILKRANENVVGTFEKSKNFGFVIADENRLGQDIFIPQGLAQGAKTGDKVVVKITRWPEPRRNPEGEIIQILGPKDAPGVDIESIIWKYHLPVDFPQAVKDEVNSMDLEVTDKDIENRRDLRELLMITIDGEDAKDLDDAVSLERTETGLYRLGVHIADVSHYVKEGSALDQEAYNRATSFYLVDRVIPMLPRELSNGLCSLHPRVNRLSMSCIMDIDNDGNVVHHEIFPSVIHIDERMTYNKVARILIDKDEELRRDYSHIVPMVEEMEQLCLVLRNRRFKRGAIDFDFPETKVKLDEQGTPIEIVKVERTIADQVIEEFMLVCNEVVAEHMHWLEVPFVYRIHEDPAEAKLSTLNTFLNTFGLGIRGLNKIHPRALQQVLEKVKGKKEERVVSTIMLRSMKQARYSEESVGHFGLAAQYYSHFTSPIRRYPDLIIHRIMRESLFGEGMSEKRKNKLAKMVPDIALQSSLQERIAVEAERDTKDLKKIQYMKQFIGETYEAIISGVTSFGIFVELDNLVEGLIHVRTMNDDYYHFREEQYCLIGEHTKKVFQIGDPIKVKLVNVNEDQKEIDFEIVQE